MSPELQIVFCVFVFCQIMPTSCVINDENLEDFYNKNDWFQVARCEARCIDLKMNNLRSCIEWCLRQGFEKPGTCPITKGKESIICLDTCKNDVQCPKAQKCCRNVCGTTCEETEGFRTAVDYDFPPIPKDISINDPYFKSQPRNRYKNHRIKSSYQIRWKFDELNEINKFYSGAITYILEKDTRVKRIARANDEENIDYSWTPCAHSRKQPIRLQGKHLLLAQWYHFRVSAVGANGTRGPSKPSSGYMTAIIPRPPGVPKNVTVTPLWVNNNTLAVELKWKSPKSDMPIDKYKIFWSRQLFDKNVLDAVIVCQKTISKHKTKVIIKNIEMPNLYFFQIQALSFYGNKRLEGQKSGLVYNTTQKEDLPNNTLSHHTHLKNYVEDLRLEKIYKKNMTINARIRWKHIPFSKSTKSAITWTQFCRDGKFHSFHNKNSSFTKLPYFDLKDLRFSCRYKMSIRKVLNGKKSSKETFITFTVPKCEDFRLNKNDKILC